MGRRIMAQPMYSAPQVVGPGPNDAAMLEPDTWYSNVLNTGLEYVMGLGSHGGYSMDRRGHQGNGNAAGTAAGDNSFYRDNASWMPGWGNTFGLDFMDPHGVPSGATAQDRATNYVGMNPGDTAEERQIWGDVRVNLLNNEQAAITAAAGRGESNISFMDVYNSHVPAYADAQAAARARNPASDAGNTFIDPASFALAMYGAPLAEHLGINMGPATGASIDLFNDPTDSVGEGWAKRMGLAAGEIGVGAGALGMGLGNMATGNILTGLGQSAAGVGLMGLGAFSGAWNTATAIGNGMGVSEAVDGIGTVGGQLLDAGGQMASDAWGAVTSW
jgi:hypothetical protein